MIEVTLGTWHEAITAGRSWDQTRDTPRIRGAFSTLLNTCDRWPAPKHFLDALPRVEDAPRLRHEFKPARPEVVAKAREEIKSFVADPNPKPEAETKVEVKRIGEVERELQEHYGTVGKMAAAGPDQ